MRTCRISTCLTSLFGAFLLFTSAILPQSARAACEPLPTTNGTASFTVRITQQGTYRLWTHMLLPSTDKNGLYAKIDETCKMNIGDSPKIPTGAFTWIDYQNGTSADKTDVTLAVGEHTITLAGLDDGVGVDKVMLINDTTCTPQSDGTNCTMVASTAPPANSATAISDIATPVLSAATTTNHWLKTFLTNPWVFGILLGSLVAIGLAIFIWLRHPALIQRAWDSLRMLFGWPSKVPAPIPSQPGVSAKIPITENPVVRWATTRAGRITLTVVIAVIALMCGFLITLRALAGSANVGFILSNAKVSGNAAIVEQANAISGKMVRFGVTPATVALQQYNQQPTSNHVTAPTAPAPTPSRDWSNIIPAGWPTPDTTGWQHTGAKLAPYGRSGQDIDITQDNTVIDGVEIHGTLNIMAKNVTIKRSKIVGDTCNNSYGCHIIDGYFANASNLTLEDVEIVKPDNFNNIDRAVVATKGAVIRRAYIHGVDRGILTDDNVLVEDSYIDDFNPTPAAGSHTSGITIRASNNVTIRHNTIGLLPNNASSGAIAIYDSQDDNHIPTNNLTFDSNLINGGSACLWDSPGPRTDGFMKFTNNLFGIRYYSNCGDYYPTHIVDSGPNQTFNNNKWYAPGDSRNGKDVPML